jgi:hypothetical protein
MADWRELYKATVLETNPTQLEQLIKETEDAIFLRVRALAGSLDSKKERRKIAAASAALWTLKTEKLNLKTEKLKMAGVRASQIPRL